MRCTWFARCEPATKCGHPVVVCVKRNLRWIDSSISMNRPAVLALLLGVVALRMVSAQLVNLPDAFSAVGVARQSNAKNSRAIRARSVSVNLGLFDRKDAQQIL